MRLLLLIFLLLTAAVSAVAQAWTLEPTHWYPLSLGNYWHYNDANEEGVSIPTNRIAKSVRDTTDADGVRWVLFEEVWCNGPICNVPSTQWRRFDDDHYLLSARSPDRFATPDTVWASRERSIFTVDQDSTWLTFTHRGRDLVRLTSDSDKFSQGKPAGHRADGGAGHDLGCRE